MEIGLVDALAEDAVEEAFRLARSRFETGAG
jgi:hypothetical protein